MGRSGITLSIVNLYDGPSFSELPSEGSTMTEIRKDLFLHLGGPYDGEQMLVEVDSDGVPTETNTIRDITSPNQFHNPTVTIQVNGLTSLYERESRLGDTDFEYVFRYVIQDVQNWAGRTAA